MIRSAPRPSISGSSAQQAVTASLQPAPARLSLALVSDAALPGSVFDGLDADIIPVARSRGIAPLLAPGLDAILYDIGIGSDRDFDALARVVSLGPDVPVIALFENHVFNRETAARAIDQGADDACIFDAFHAEDLLTPTTIAIARYARLKTVTPVPTPEVAAEETVEEQSPVTVVQEAADAMVILDNDGKVAFANSAAAELLGRPLESLAGERLEMPTTPGERDIRIKQPSGEERTADLRIVETEWGGQPARVAAFTDTTVRKQLEQTIRDAEKQGLTSERRTNSFFSNVNHDLRTPLTHIIGFSEIMKDAQFGPLADRYREYARDIHQSGTMLLDIIEDLLSVAESKPDDSSLANDICNLDALLETVVTAQKRTAADAGVTLSVRSCQDLPGFRGDAKKLRQGIFRLISELLHTTGNGSCIELSVKHAQQSLVIEAAIDSPDGTEMALPYDHISQDACALVEDPFVSAEGRSRPRDMGLALSLTRKIAELHGGSLSIEKSTQGHAVVEMRLPAARLVR
ncbi:MAG: PAS domain-containing protein [Rhodobiaceae bacterium]|nr:PAS domain-containing protein [Rhodobiaceae bacterium]